MSKPSLDYLVEISKNQFVAASKRDVQLGIPLSAGNTLRGELEAAGLISIEHVNTYSSAKRVVNTKITEKGYALLKSVKVQFEEPRGRGRWEHKFHQHSVAAWARACGYIARIEHTHDGKAVDVSLQKDGSNVAVEILCQGVKKELANLRDLCTGYSAVWFAVKDSKEGKQLEQLIRQTFGDEANEILRHVSFKLLGGFQNASAGMEAQTGERELTLFEGDLPRG